MAQNIIYASDFMMSHEYMQRSLNLNLRNTNKHKVAYEGIMTMAGSEPYETYNENISLKHIEEMMEITNNKIENLNNEIYNLKLHGSIQYSGSFYMIRVPGVGYMIGLMARYLFHLVMNLIMKLLNYNFIKN